MEPLIIFLLLVTVIVHSYSPLVAVCTLVIGGIVLYLIYSRCNLDKWTSSRLYAFLMGYSPQRKP